MNLRVVSSRRFCRNLENLATLVKADTEAIRRAGKVSA
jgi:hypothetical protein